MGICPLSSLTVSQINVDDVNASGDVNANSGSVNTPTVNATNVNASGKLDAPRMEVDGWNDRASSRTIDSVPAAVMQAHGRLLTTDGSIGEGYNIASWSFAGTGIRNGTFINNFLTNNSAMIGGVGVSGSDHARMMSGNATTSSFECKSHNLPLGTDGNNALHSTTVHFGIAGRMA